MDKAAMTRKINKDGAVVIPAQIRRRSDSDKYMIHVRGEEIVLVPVEDEKEE